MTMILTDNADPSGRKVEVRAVEGHGFFEVRVAGYGEHGTEPGYGSVLALEVYKGRLRLLVFADIEREGPSHVIDLEAAREGGCD
jgi:hypothetical protein